MGRRHNHRSGWGRPLVSLATLALLGTGAWLLAPHSQGLLERAARLFREKFKNRSQVF